MSRLTSVQWTWILIAGLSGVAAVYYGLETANARGEFKNLQSKRSGLETTRDETLSRLEAIQSKVDAEQGKSDAIALELAGVHEQVSLLKNHTKDLEQVASELVLLDEAIQAHESLSKEFEQLFTEVSGVE